MKILYVEDHDIVRESIKTMLLAHNDLDVEIDEASNGEIAMTMLEQSDYDILLLDVSLPKKGGLAIARELKKENRKEKVIALTMHREELIVKQMLDADVRGFLLKNAGLDELIKAINTVYKEGKYYSNEIAQMVINDVLNKEKQKDNHKRRSGSAIYDDALTHREEEVLQLLIEGKTTDEIAEQLSISPKTVSNHRSNMLSKFNMKNTAALVSYAVTNKLLE